MGYLSVGLSNVLGSRWMWCFKRYYWNVGNVGDGVGYSNKLSLSLLFRGHNWAIGVTYGRVGESRITYISFLPLSLRIHWKKNYGGRYI